MSAQAAADGQAGPAEGACVVMQEGVNAAGGAWAHTLHCGAWGEGEAHGWTNGQTEVARDGGKDTGCVGRE